MNRRNFVVGLGTVATASGVASVTAASFADSVQPTAEFNVIPDDRRLVIGRTSEYNDTDLEWTGDETLLDEPTQEDLDNNNNPIAYSDDQEDGNLTLQLAFANENNEYTEYSTGFFEVDNQGAEDEAVGVTFEYGADVTGGDITEQQVVDIFTFEIGSTQISPETDGDGPLNYATVGSEGTEQVGLTIDLTDPDIRDAINTTGGGVFEDTADSLELVSAINVGTEPEN